MQVLYELREALMDELYQMKGRKLTEGLLDAIDKATHSIKSIDTILAMEESSRESRESRESRDGYSGRRYRDGSREGSRDGGTSGRRRDSMGRFRDGSSNDDYSGDEYSGRRGYSRAEARDKLVTGLEDMMQDVSPESQRVIQKAIRVIEKE